MSGYGQKYVLDTNTLSQIGRRRRDSDFFKENVVLPEEVLREAGEFPDLGNLRRRLYPTTAQVLEGLVRVMATVPVDDTRLVDLYRNKGGADPLLVACALDGQARDSAYLDAPEWVVVTADDAARRKAKEFGLTTLSNTEFAALIDMSESPVNADGLYLSTPDGDTVSRICSKCGTDCALEPREEDDGFRIAFVCPQHGVQSVVYPFEGER
jgi:hypothetical protein